MANTTQFQGLDVNSIFVEAQNQFRGLNPNEPGQWPILPKVTAFAAVAIAVVVLGWVALLSTESDNLESARQKEPTLKADYRAKLTQAVNLSELLKQKTQVEEYVRTPGCQTRWTTGPPSPAPPLRWRRPRRP